MKYFIAMNLKGKQVPDDVLDSVLNRPDIFESMRIVLGPDGDKIGAKHMDRVEEAIKNEMKIHKNKNERTFSPKLPEKTLRMQTWSSNS